MHGTAERRRDRLGIGTSGAGADSDVRSDEQRTDADARVRDRGGDRQAAREDSRPVCRAHRSIPAGMSEVIALPAGTRIWLAAGVTDMRCGFQGLAAKVQTALEENPLGGHLFIFRGRRGDLVKLLWATDDGLWLLAKRLEQGRFIWPQADGGKIHLTSAQLSMLLEGIDWRQPRRTAALSML